MAQSKFWALNLCWWRIPFLLLFIKYLFVLLTPSVLLVVGKLFIVFHPFFLRRWILPTRKSSVPLSPLKTKSFLPAAWCWCPPAPLARTFAGTSRTMECPPRQRTPVSGTRLLSSCSERRRRRRALRGRRRRWRRYAERYLWLWMSNWLLWTSRLDWAFVCRMTSF